MATNSSLLQERMTEARASAEAAMVARILNDLVIEPSTKRFVKGRATRIERWQQLAACATAQVNGLQALAKCAAPRKPRVAKCEQPQEQPSTAATA